MQSLPKHHASLNGYVAISTIALICALVFTTRYPTDMLPGVGQLPLLQLTLLAAVAGYPLLWFLQRRGMAPSGRFVWGRGQIWRIVLLGTLLALPPIAIDLLTGFSRNMNVPIPAAFLFYPAVALLADVLFHLLPLAALTWMSQGKVRIVWLFAPVVFTEPIFQAANATGPTIQTWLVFANVSLISAAQLWVFWRHGFGAMIALRLVFYFVWHIVWGVARLALLW